MTSQSAAATNPSTGSDGEVRLPALQAEVHKTYLYLFFAKASILYNLLKINRKVEDKDEGYQRALSQSRVHAIARYIQSGNVIPGSIIVTLDRARFDRVSNELIIPRGPDAGWVIDGQHRLAGAYEATAAGVDPELAVVAFIDLDETRQIDQFVTINREAKGVPTSLYLDLLRRLPRTKTLQEYAKERATDIALELRRDEESPFCDRIVITRPPKQGQLSLNNFVRKVAPQVMEGKGFLHIYTEKEQTAIISNYFKGFANVFPAESRSADPIFFKTLGFGGLMNAFSTVFSRCLAEHKGFRAADVTDVLRRIEGFDFSGWRELGTGNAAETQAGNDLIAALEIAYRKGGDEGSRLPL